MDEEKIHTILEITNPEENWSKIIENVNYEN